MHPFLLITIMNNALLYGAAVVDIRASRQSRFVGHRHNATKGSLRFKKVQFFLTLFKRPLTPPPFYLNICPILQGVKILSENFK